MNDSPEQHKSDPFYKKAKQESFRARSAYKLLDIQKKINIFKRAFYILDIGSAPGSWLQVSKKFAEENLEKYNDAHYHRDHYKILGVDIKNISPIEGVNTIKIDLKDPNLKQEISSFFQKKLDLILSDASIKKSGNTFSDCIRQIRLCQHVYDLADEFLKKKGVLVLKLFQGADFQTFFTFLKKSFRWIKAYKPKASKKGSNEIYVICQNKI